MRRYWVVLLFMLVVGGCSKQPDQTTIEESSYHIYSFSEQDIIVESSRVYFRSSQEILSASIVDIEDLNQEVMLKPNFVNIGFCEVSTMDEADKGKLYAIDFNLNFKNHEKIEFSKIKVEINGEEYDSVGHYYFDYTKSKDQFVKDGNPISAWEGMFYTKNYVIEDNAENISFKSSDERVLVKNIRPVEHEKDTYHYELDFQKPYLHSYTTFILNYEVEGVLHEGYIWMPVSSLY